MFDSGQWSNVELSFKFKFKAKAMVKLVTMICKSTACPEVSSSVAIRMGDIVLSSVHDADFTSPGGMS